MRNEELHKEIVKILEGQAEFRVHIENIKDKLTEIHATDQEQYKLIKQQNGRVGKLEVKIEALEKADIRIEQESKSNSVKAFWEKNWKAILIVMMLILGFKDYLLDIIL